MNGNLINLMYLQIVRPVSALVVVDVQNDFITGSLSISNCPAQQNGAEVNFFTPYPLHVLYN